MTTTALRAFHGKPQVQSHYLARVEAHYLADEIAQGAYVRDLSAGGHAYCAVGCVLHDPHGGHDRYETELGIPTSLAYLEDRIFESLSKADAKEWPLAFMSVIPIGADLSRVTHLFLAWLMDDPTYGVASTTTDAELKELALEVARRYRTGEGLAGPEAEALADRLRAARAARAAWTARDARTARAARDARTARDAWDARDAWAAWAARAARDAWDAWDAWAARDARAAFVRASASELLRLLIEAPVPPAAEAA